MDKKVEHKSGCYFLEDGSYLKRHCDCGGFDNFRIKQLELALITIAEMIEDGSWYQAKKVITEILDIKITPHSIDVNGNCNKGCC